MYTEPELVRRELIIRRLLKEVDHWWQVKACPIKLQILSAKYSRQLYSLGGFPEVIEELVIQGKLKTSLLNTGAKLVYPSYGVYFDQDE